MTTLKQIIKGCRKKKFHYNSSKLLVKCPQKKGICLKIRTMAPKKPNSAVRKIVKVRLTTARRVLAYIPGQGHNLHEHSRVLVRGGKVPDLPGIHYKLIRGKYDFTWNETFERQNRRSKFGIPGFKKLSQI
jgi:small subunit ribosomal protein S12